jgi:peptidoglycan hydrolase-like protein with peptidoglycan-binding domain
VRWKADTSRVNNNKRRSLDDITACSLGLTSQEAPQTKGEIKMLKTVLLLIAASLLLATSMFSQGTATAANTTSASPAATTPKRSAVFRPTKDQIAQVQKILKDKKLYTGEATGKYDDGTRAGIKSFQKDNGLKETGTLNRATLEKFGVELTDAQKAIPASPNSYASADDKTPSSKSKDSKSGSSKSTSNKTIFRATSDQVKAAQKILKDGSMYSGEQTGKLDEATRDGLKKYQDANGLKVTGTLNQATLEKMGIELTDKQKAASSSSTTTQE